jgi:zinc protease
MRSSGQGENMRAVIARCFLIVVSALTLFSAAVRTAGAADILRATLENGLRTVIVRNGLAPTVTTQVNYLVGSNEAPPGFPGMAHAQEHMLFRGSPGLSAEQLAAIIAALGGEFNADTQQTVTQYFFTVPAEDIDVALHIEAIRMRGVLDTQELWDKERGAIEQEVAQDISSPSYLLYSRLLAEMFSGTPYAHDALGTRASFQATTGEMLKKFHEAWYAPNNAVIVIVGDVDPDRTLNTVKKLFGPISPRPLPLRPSVTPQPLKPATIELESDLPYGLSVVAYRLPGFESPDFAAGQILADVLESRRGNLYALVAEGKALFTEFSGGALPKAAFGYASAAFPNGGDGQVLVSAIKNIVAEYVKSGVPAELVEAAKRHEVVDAEFQKNSVTGLASLWSQALAVEGRNSPDDDIEAIRKVTVADVNRVARQYLVNDAAITAVLTPQPSGKPVAAEGPRRKESFAPKQTKPVSLPAWAKKAAALPALPPRTVKPAVTALPNGLRLIVQPETISKTVTVLGQIKNNPGLETPKGQEGVDEILDGLFSYGTTTLDRLGFQKALDDIAADVSAGTSFSLKVPAEHFDRGVQLLAENLLHPALPEAAFTVVRQETVDSLAGLEQSPAYLAGRALKTALYPRDDPALRRATPATVATLKLDDIKEYYRTVFRPDMTTMVVIGRVTPEQAKAVIENYFGRWQAAGPKPGTELPSAPPNKPSTTAVPDASRVQTAVTLAQTLGLKRSDPDYYTLQVGNHVLSGAFYATRLYQDLRERAGLVYTVESFLDVGKTRSLFGVAYACDPENVSKARALVERDLREMQTILVTPAELRQAQTLLIRQIPLSQSSTDGIAAELLGLSLEDLPLDEPVRAAKRYREITPPKLRAAFTRWIRPADFVQVTLGPGPK